jgi:hypothetical protein
MSRAAVVVLLLAVAAAGCGGKKHAAPAGTTTAATDPASCARLERNIALVSQLISGSVELMTQSVHPKQLAKRAGDTQRNLAYAADVLAREQVPASLEPAKRQFVAGLRAFSADFGRAQQAVARNDLRTAALALVDRPALAKVKAATRTIDRACAG